MEEEEDVGRRLRRRRRTRWRRRRINMSCIAQSEFESECQYIWSCGAVYLNW